jgi:surface antigen
MHRLAPLLVLSACTITIPPVGADTLYGLMSDADRDLARETAHRAVADNAPQTWTSPRTGYTGTIVLERAFTIAGGLRCGEYTEILTVQGRQAASRNTACEDGAGKWRTVVTSNVR